LKEQTKYNQMPSVMLDRLQRILPLADQSADKITCEETGDDRDRCCVGGTRQYILGEQFTGESSGEPTEEPTEEPTGKK